MPKMPGREQMIEEIKVRYCLDSPRVFSAMLQVPREEFVPENLRSKAYDDCAISIGHGQTISQPYTVAFMTDLLDLKGREKVLEIGTGSGYQAAVLSNLADKVYSVEIVPELAKQAFKRFKKFGFKNIEVKTGSGEFGWKEKSPFDAILVTAGMDKVPEELFDQLKSSGILVAPVGARTDKMMVRYVKNGKKIKKEEFGSFYFVPFVESN